MKVKEKNDELLAEDRAAKQDGKSDGRYSDAMTEIQRRAYQLWQERGGNYGKELDDWLQAEAEINAAFGPLEQDQTKSARQQPRQQPKQPRYNKHATAD